MPVKNATFVAVTVAVTGFIVALLALIAVLTGVISANADAKPGFLETWAAKISLGATLVRETRTLRNPLRADVARLVDGVRLYGDNCAVCHGSSDGKRSTIARGLYQKPPQFAKDDVADDPVEVTYWKITHGIRLTGMPAYGESLTDNERWAVALFLKHQTSLPPKAEKAWRQLHSAAKPSQDVSRAHT